MEFGTLIQPAFSPNFPAMTINYALDQRQPHASALEFILAMEPLEYSEELVGVFHVEAGPIVLDRIDDIARYALGENAYARLFGLP